MRRTSAMPQGADLTLGSIGVTAPVGHDDGDGVGVRKGLLHTGGVTTAPLKIERRGARKAKGD